MNEIKLFCPASVANVSCGFDILGICLENVGDEMIISRVIKPAIMYNGIQIQPAEIQVSIAAK